MKPQAPALCFIVLMLMSGFHCASAAPCYPAIFVFGDSLSDTGNGPRTLNPFFIRTTMRPYGETRPGYAFSRFSDGYLIMDNIATFLGLPLLNPSLNVDADFSKGVNYAVSGATALNTTFLLTYGVVPLATQSLEVQLGWHLAFKASIPSGGAPGKPIASAFTDGLYVIEIGGNDYSSSFQMGKTPAYVNSTILPLVIQKINYVTDILYTNGARNFLFLSITPLGCSPSYLASYTGSKDSDGCLVDYNSVAYNHGVSLKNLAASLRVTYPSATFTFADYYGAYTYILQNKATYGFTDTLNACCGTPGAPNRYNIATFCNVLSTTLLNTLCANPNVYLNWDGFHFTDKFNNEVSNLFTSGSYLDPSSGLTC